METVHRFVTNDFSIRAAAVNATQVVREMQQLSASRPIPTVAVGRAMVGAILLASTLKEDQEVGLLVQGTGPLSRVYGHANSNGNVRGYSSDALFEPPQYEVTLSLKPWIGPGHLTVVRHAPFQRQPYQGTVELVSSEIGDDIAYYLHQSQQIRSVISLGVYLDAYGRVQSAGGILLEVMPGVEEDLVISLEKNFLESKVVVSKMILDGAKPSELVEPFLRGFNYTEIPHEQKLKYFCPCTKERVSSALTILGLGELDDMIAKQEKADVTCQLCGKHYEIKVEEVEEIRNLLYKGSLH